ncbi:hypothetical protein OG871_35750 [Kitasatospora sp. NBC_00374]|uniref:hypothetical protein n=1 Tax=Kitasatospora sp. NBC_00374 TaxID=2975964 RepID=UPI0030DE958A
MKTALERDGRDRLAAALDRLPAVSEDRASSVTLDTTVVEAVVAVLGQYSAVFADEPIGRAAATIADRLQLRVPMTSLLRLDKEVGAESVDLT